MRGVLSHIIIFTRYSCSLPPNEIFVGCAHHLHTVNCSSFACGAENGRKDESESCPRPSAAAVATVSPFPVFFTRFVKICHPPSSNYYALYSHFVWLLIDDPIQCSWIFSDPNQPFYFNCQLSDSAIILANYSLWTNCSNSINLCRW